CYNNTSQGNAKGSFFPVFHHVFLLKVVSGQVSKYDVHDHIKKNKKLVVSLKKISDISIHCLYFGDLFADY
ncbi:MAG: hypothetical protein J6R96_01265, partial [Spirochaetaceae bacterium]|nr:hypothetical protein [Spirochaetaceae bacterium]